MLAFHEDPAGQIDPFLIGLGLFYVTLAAVLLTLVFLPPAIRGRATKGSALAVGLIAIAMGVILTLLGFDVIN